jgi:chromosome segregation ATPase
MDPTVIAALIASVASIVVLFLENRRLRSAKADAKADAKAETEIKDAVARKIRELNAVEEFRDTLRQDNSEMRGRLEEQGKRISLLERELLRAAEDRLQHERERLEWYSERATLQDRVSHLEELLHVHGIDEKAPNRKTKPPKAG